MDDFEELLSRDVAGRPIWQWAVIVVIGVALGLLAMRRFRGGDDQAATNAAGGDPSIDPITGLTYGAEPIGGWSIGRDFAAPASPAVPGTDQGDRTNGQWLEAASENLYGQFRAVLVDTALRKYLNGQPLTQEEITVIEAALRNQGTPPDGAPPIDRVSGGQSNSPDPTPKPPSGGGGGDADRIRAEIRSIFDKHGLTVSTTRLARLVREVQAGRTLADIDQALRPFSNTSTATSTAAASNAQTYTIRSGDTLFDIARRFSVPGGWPALYQANKAVIDAEARRRGRTPSPHLIFPGTRITIPGS